MSALCGDMVSQLCTKMVRASFPALYRFWDNGSNEHFEIKWTRYIHEAHTMLHEEKKLHSATKGQTEINISTTTATEGVASVRGERREKGHDHDVSMQTLTLTLLS